MELNYNMVLCYFIDHSRNFLRDILFLKSYTMLYLCFNSVCFFVGSAFFFFFFFLLKQILNLFCPCLSLQFILVAAAKYCVDIATHRHGCCVLQRCISHSIGEHRDKLVTEITKNGLLLAQDPFG